MSAQPIVAVVVAALYGGHFDGSVPLTGNGLPANRERDAFDLAVRPRVVGLVRRCLIPLASQIMSKRIGRE